jgi:hypothetical protein
MRTTFAAATFFTVVAMGGGASAAGCDRICITARNLGVCIATGATGATTEITGGLAKPTAFMVRPVESGVSNGGADRLVVSERADTADKPAAGMPVFTRNCEKYPLPERICFAAESVAVVESCDARLANESALVP